jgi:hypothetical protein
MMQAWGTLLVEAATLSEVPLMSIHSLGLRQVPVVRRWFLSLINRGFPCCSLNTMLVALCSGVGEHGPHVVKCPAYHRDSGW